MSKISQIDRNMPLTFYACVSEVVADPVMVALADQLQMPHLLNCDVPLPPASQVEVRDQATVELVLGWLQQNQRWCARIESTLQCMANDSDGRPLLTAFMPIDEFAMLVEDLVIEGLLPDLHLPLAEWRAKGATNFYIDGYRLDAGHGRQPKN
ncbi:hypothetical protein [Pseudomonas chlororaphis]|uniref:hypothetical protein n=1 Tax=Pseudomonas chlororaphis TaxID=587753 RepID=UPI002D76AD25|nr:hypothetical protein [Pseudomonas chlororaphis]